MAVTTIPRNVLARSIPRVAVTRTVLAEWKALREGRLKDTAIQLGACFHFLCTFLVILFFFMVVLIGLLSKIYTHSLNVTHLALHADISILGFF